MSTPVSVIALCTAAALWGSNGVAARAISESFQPIFLSWSRWLVAMLVIAPFVWKERGALRQAMAEHWRLICLLSMLANVPQSALIYVGIQSTSVINVGLLNSAIPVLVLILGHFFFKRRMQLSEGIGVLISVFGVSLLLFEGSIDRLRSLTLNKGDAFAFAGMLTWALYTLLVHRRPATVSLLGFVFCMSLAGVAICAPIVIAEMWLTKPPEFRNGAVATLFYIAIGPTLLGTLCFTYGTASLGAAKAGIFVHLMPVFSAIFAIAFVGESIAGFHLAGFALIAGGAVFSLRGKRH